MKLEYVSSKTLDFPEIISKNVTVTLHHSDLKIKALIFYADNSTVAVSIANSPLFKKGVRCTLELLYKEKLLQLECKIKSFEDGILYFDMPRNVNIIQQRSDLRVGCNIKCTVEQLTTGKIKNISAGGCYIDLDSPIKANFLDSDDFKLCFSINHTDLRLHCSVIELTHKSLRAKFINIDDETKQFLTLYCCSTDVELYRRGRFDR